MKKTLVAFILLRVFGAGSEEIARKIRRVDGITEVRVVFGEYDVIARAEVSSLDELGLVVMDSIQKMGENIDTITLISSY